MRSSSKRPPSWPLSPWRVVAAGTCTSGQTSPLPRTARSRGPLPICPSRLVGRIPRAALHWLSAQKRPGSAPGLHEVS